MLASSVWYHKATYITIDICKRQIQVEKNKYISDVLKQPIEMDSQYARNRKQYISNQKCLRIALLFRPGGVGKKE